MTQRVGLPVLVCLVLLTGGALNAASGATARPSQEQASTTVLSPADFGARLLTRINTRRGHQGCRQYRPNAALGLAAARHNDAMVADHELSHRLAGEADLGPRITAAGYTNWRRLAENLAWGQASPRAVFRAWVASAGHRANLDDCRLRDIGIAVAISNGRPWVTADFGRRYHG